MIQPMTRTRNARSIRGAEREALAARVSADYVNGHTVAEAAARSGISFAMAHKLLEESGVERRTPFESRKMARTG